MLQLFEVTKKREALDNTTDYLTLLLEHAAYAIARSVIQSFIPNALLKHPGV
jgi:hypothetical protein